MRTNIDLDDALLAQAMRACGATTKRGAVEEAMRLTVRLKGQEGILKWRGRIHWEGDLDVSREGRFLDWGAQPVSAETAEVETPEAEPVR